MPLTKQERNTITVLIILAILCIAGLLYFGDQGGGGPNQDEIAPASADVEEQAE